MRILFRFVCFILALAIFIGFPLQAVAQKKPDDRLSLGVSPGMREIAVAPGETKKVTIDVTNITSVALPVKAVVSKFVTLEDVAPNDQAIFDASRWFTVQEPDFILQPNQKKTVSITVSAPQNAEPGGHYATVYFQPLVPSQLTKEHGARIGARVGSLFFIIVKGDITESLHVVSLKTPHVQQSGPVELQLTLRNNGNVHTIPSGSIRISDFKGRKLTDLPIPMSVVLPHTEKILHIRWENKGTMGLFGAQAQLRYGTPQKTSASEMQRFWVVPWLKSTIIIITFAGIGLFVWRTHKRWVAVFHVLFKNKEQ